ncbi:MAG: galactose-1-phosphate uridylyltransferase [Nitrospirae bacterium]|nr:galactose-1-phosphate uridylyltransferase [Nitrospirota bacterium]
MPELRLNLVTKEWVIIATERAKRPEDFKISREKKETPSFVDTCPFCPGNESKTPDEVFRVSDGNQWKIRVVPNKFAALNRDIERIRTNDGYRHTVSGFGVHDVLVETPVHNMATALLPLDHVAMIIRAYLKRFAELYSDPRIGHVIIFKNHGAGAGTSLEHPHSQIIGTPVTPFQIRDRVEEAIRFFDLTGECLICKTIAEEKKDSTRIILETGHFISFIPYASLSPFHTWIFPKRHAATFSEITETEIVDLALNLKTTLAKFYYGLNNPDFNYVIRSNRTKDARLEHSHWYISIVPRLSMTAGFEMGSGMYINTAMPEASAEFMRKVKVPQQP